MAQLVENEKKVYSYRGEKFILEDIAIPRSIIAPLNLKEEDIPKYEMRDRKHYNAAQFHFFEDRQWLRGCEEHREIRADELCSEISGPLEKGFRWCYFQKFNGDETKVGKIGIEGQVAA